MSKSYLNIFNDFLIDLEENHMAGDQVLSMVISDKMFEQIGLQFDRDVRNDNHMRIATQTASIKLTRENVMPPRIK